MELKELEKRIEEALTELGALRKAMEKLEEERATIKYIEAEKRLEQCLENEAKIVRCRDCIWHPKCRYEQILGLDGFCSRGEWRNKNADSV